MLDNQASLNTPEWTALLTPQPDHELSKVRQLYLALYEAIASQMLPQGQKIPSSRDLAKQLNVGRNTVIAVYSQLNDEGLISSNGRKGTRITYSAAAQSINARHQSAQLKRSSITALSSRSTRTTSSGATGLILAPGMPDPALFPQSDWRKALHKASRLSPDSLGYNAKPLAQLQAAIARYLAVYRSLKVDDEQIIITSSTRQSLMLAATLYADAGAHAWLESPGYRGAAEACQLLGLNLHALAVDLQGCTLPDTETLPSPALIYLTPCFQYPSGFALSANRRSEFIDYARANNAVIFEDDYDSEFRDDSQARPALASQVSSSQGCVILHAGTFSKLIFPAARIAWLVVPGAHVEKAQRCLQMLGGGHNTIAQATIAELLSSGAVSRHLQRARVVYARRRQVMLETLNACDLFYPLADTGGSLSMVAHLKNPVDPGILRTELNRCSLGVQTLESLQVPVSKASQVNALVLGLGNIKTLDIANSVKLLGNSLKRSSIQ